jgi:hypothetical protein
MGRKKIAPPSKGVQAMDAIVQNQNEKQMIAAKAFEVFGIEGKEYDLLSYSQMAINVLKLHEATGVVGGRILLVIKENEPHGVFLKALEKIGIHPRTAQRYINIARRFGKSDNLSYLSDSKLSVLDELSDPELEKLDAGEDVLGLNLDTVDKMTASELRKRIRKAQHDMEVKARECEDEVNKMSSELQDLRMRAVNQSPPTKEEKIRAEAQKQLDPLLPKLYGHFKSAWFHLDEAVNTVAAAQKIEGVTFIQLQEWAMKHYEELAPISEIYEELDEALNHCGPDKPKANSKK